MFFGKLFYIQLLIALVWLCTPPAGVARLLAKFLSMTVLEPPVPSVELRTPPGGVFMTAPGGLSILMCSPAVSHVFCGYRICFQTAPGDVREPYIHFLWCSAVPIYYLVFSSRCLGMCCVRGSITVFLLIVLLYSFSGFGSLLIPFSFFFVFFIRFSFRCFRFLCLRLSQ